MSYNLYKDTYTCVTNRSPTFMTNPIPIKQRVIQGDSLSPTVFIIMMDPLLRWLQTGHMGYDTGIRHVDNQDTLDIPSMAFADDLTLLTGNVRNLRAQNLKLSEYSAWAGIRINPRECECSMMDWGDDNPLGKSTRQQYERKLNGVDPITVTVQGEINTIPFTEPTQPIKYLGAHITLSLDSSHQVEHTAVQLQEDTQKLHKSGLNPAAQEDTLASTALPRATYPFALTLPGAKHFARLDIIIRNFAKRSRTQLHAQRCTSPSPRPSRSRSSTVPAVYSSEYH
jgi:hypothetical protein